MIFGELLKRKCVRWIKAIVAFGQSHLLAEVSYLPIVSLAAIAQPSWGAAGLTFDWLFEIHPFVLT
jgi:hypothetical protein